MSLIYLAGPLTHKDHAIEEHRAHQHCLSAGEFLKNGLIVYSPIAETWNIGKHSGINGKWETWRKKDLALLSKCDEMVILEIDGWTESKGVRGEIKFCITNNIPISLYKPGSGYIELISPNDLLEKLDLTMVEQLND